MKSSFNIFPVRKRDVKKRSPAACRNTRIILCSVDRWQASYFNRTVVVSIIIIQSYSVILALLRLLQSMGKLMRLSTKVPTEGQQKNFTVSQIKHHAFM